VVRWLHGKGHPAQLRGGCVSTQRFDADIDDPLIRSRLLLQAVSDTNLLSANPSDRLHVSDSVLDAVQLRSTPRQVVVDIAAPDSSSSASQPAISIQTCSRKMTVTISPWLENVLIEVCGMHDGKSTKFDAWFHAQMLVTGYNVT
jgi:hypothetical protein